MKETGKAKPFGIDAFGEKDLIVGEIRRQIVFRNLYGFWQSSLKWSCLLNSTLNVLDKMKQLDEDMAQGITEKFCHLKEEFPDERFIKPGLIPSTIEYITGSKFHGILIGPDAIGIVERASMKFGGIKSVEKYALNRKGAFNRSDCPFILTSVIMRDNDCFGHATAVTENTKDGYLVLDNGVPKILRNPPNYKGYFYKIAKNEMGGFS